MFLKINLLLKASSTRKRRMSNGAYDTREWHNEEVDVVMLSL